MNVWKGAITEDGVGSISRMSIAAVITMSVFCVLFLVLKNGQMPDLGGLTLFDTGVIGVLYGINKAPAITSAITGK